jgi:hypothetical protein
MQTYVLIFTRDERSEVIALKMGLDVEMIRDFRDNYLALEAGSLQLKDFPIYATRLENVEREYVAWQKGSGRDAVGGFGVWRVAFGWLVGVLVLGIMAVQTYDSFRVTNLVSLSGTN